MKLIKILTAIAFAACIVASPAFAADKAKGKAAGCCAKAKKDGKDCEHKCCVEAKKAGKNCEKCKGSN
ncbi:MAG: hypothetical protein HYZ36_09090 [Pedosphaera parvula]|nr:hypothetical protein [Pedosphaera parvula]